MATDIQEIQAKRMKPNHFIENGVPFSDLKHNPSVYTPKEDDPYFYKFNIQKYFYVDKLLSVPVDSFLSRLLTQTDTYSLLTVNDSNCPNSHIASLLHFYKNDFILTGFIYTPAHIKNIILTEAIHQQRMRDPDKCTLGLNDFEQFHNKEILEKNAPIDVYELALFLRTQYITTIVVTENKNRPAENDSRVISSVEVDDKTRYVVLYINRDISNNVMILTRSFQDRVKLLFTPEEIFEQLLHEYNICKIHGSTNNAINPIKKIELKLKTLHESSMMPERLRRKSKQV